MDVSCYSTAQNPDDRLPSGMVLLKTPPWTFGHGAAQNPTMDVSRYSAAQNPDGRLPSGMVPLKTPPWTFQNPYHPSSSDRFNPDLSVQRADFENAQTHTMDISRYVTLSEYFRPNILIKSKILESKYKNIFPILNRIRTNSKIFSYGRRNSSNEFVRTLNPNIFPVPKRIIE